MTTISLESMNRFLGVIEWPLLGVLEVSCLPLLTIAARSFAHNVVVKTSIENENHLTELTIRMEKELATFLEMQNGK